MLSGNQREGKKNDCLSRFGKGGRITKEITRSEAMGGLILVCISIHQILLSYPGIPNKDGT